MIDPLPSDARRTIRQWLRNELRLGVTHCAIAPAQFARRSAAPPAVRPAAGPAHPPPRPAPRAETRDPLPPVIRSAAPPMAPPPPRSRFHDEGPPPLAPRPTRPAVAASPRIFVDDPALPPIETRELSREEAVAALAALDQSHVRKCEKCPLHRGRKQTVFGTGNPRPDLVFVGEGPGADEDEQGLPFVGRAGQLLTAMIAAMTLTREQVFICNVVKCRPPGNRTPTDDEMAACLPYLVRQLAILRPKVIVTLGRPASQTLLGSTTAIGQLRGRWHDFPTPALAGLSLSQCRLMPTFHPAYLLRSPGEKGKSWSDLKEVMSVLGLKPPPEP